jgi:hypothetical protein
MTTFARPSSASTPSTAPRDPQGTARIAWSFDARTITSAAHTRLLPQGTRACTLELTIRHTGENEAALNAAIMYGHGRIELLRDHPAHCATIGQDLAIDAGPTLHALLRAENDSWRVLYAVTDLWQTLGVLGGRYELQGR